MFVTTPTRRQTGFTIVELLIVIVVIGILAAITIVAYNGVQQRARDTQRKSDLSAIAKAISIRAVDHDTVLRSGTTCTANTSGFFNQAGTSLTGSTYGSNSAMDCLAIESHTSGKMADPSGATSCVSGAPDKCFVYMFASCSSGTYIYAHLESEPVNTTATDDTCQIGYDSSWGINYYVKI